MVVRELGWVGPVWDAAYSRGWEVGGGGERGGVGGGGGERG